MKFSCTRCCTTEKCYDRVLPFGWKYCNGCSMEYCNECLKKCKECGTRSCKSCLKEGYHMHKSLVEHINRYSNILFSITMNYNKEKERNNQKKIKKNKIHPRRSERLKGKRINYKE